MKRLFAVLLAFVMLINLAACGKKIPELPEDPIVFTIGEFVPPDDLPGYMTVEHDGRSYIMFGCIAPRGAFRDIGYAYGECLGYVEDDENQRIYTFEGLSSDEWLIEFYVAGFMENPIVLREISCKGNEVPDCVESFRYDYWEK